jgi:CelD/BcsL family acetyltransferase involved in cellulose biosynthesis
MSRAPAMRSDEAGGIPAAVPLADALAARAAWEDLARSALSSNVFAEPAMLAAAAGRIAPADWTLVRALGRDGRLDGVAILRPARLAALAATRLQDGFWSHYGPRAGFLLRAGVPDAADRLAARLAEAAPVIRFGYVPLDDPATSALETAILDRGGRVLAVDVHERAVLDLRVPLDEALGSGLRGKRLKELGRQYRRLYEGGTVEHQAAASPAEVSAALDRFAALEHSGWKGRLGTSLAASPERLAFARALTADLAADGRVRIDVMSCGGRDVAALITLFSADTGFLWKIAHDEAFAAVSPGVQIVARATDAFRLDRGLATVDSLATSDHPMIDRLWARRMRVGTLVVATGPTAVSAADRVAWLHGRIEGLKAGARALRASLAPRPQP